MRNIYKITGVLFLSILMVISSCKKEDDILVVNGCTDATAYNYDANANTDNGSCEPFIYGCTDPTQFNYDPTANTDNGSCEYAYDMAQGIWNIETMCQELTISIPLIGDFPVPLNDMFPEQIEILGEGAGVISLDINGEQVFADVSNDGSIIIQDGQSITIDSGMAGLDQLDVNITGSGDILSSTNGELTLDLSFEVPLAGTQSSSCDIIFTK